MPRLDAKEYPEAHWFVYVEERGKRRGVRFDFWAPHFIFPFSNKSDVFERDKEYILFKNQVRF